MTAFRVQVKLFLENSEGVDLASFSGLFQRWIQGNALNELLIDVADYRHVFEGPGIILIGHESDYGIERQNDRVGLLYTRKRQTDPDLQTQFRVSLQRALTAAHLIEAEPSFNPRLKFLADEIEIRVLDRLQYPNRPETFEAVRSDLQAVLTDLYGDYAYDLAPVQQDTRHVFAIKVQAEAVDSISNLISPVQLKVEE